MNAIDTTDRAFIAGRSCPLAYRYLPSDMAVPARLECELLYVVGGLYGNEAALDEVLDMFDREPGDKRLVFNGDFNWFDIDPAAFGRINERVLVHGATRGNVETELAADDPSAGCGCAYPDSVDQGTVDRSNRISARLVETARSFPALLDRLRSLPMWQRIDVGDRRVAIVHGDAQSLAGWGFAQEALASVAQQRRVDAWFDAAQVDVFASSHTCLPVLHTAGASANGAGRIVVNNGAAGMPNFQGTRHGMLTRIGLQPYRGPQRLYGTSSGNVFVDALKIDYDADRFATAFLAQWPAGSDAHRSYWQRIGHGPSLRLHDARSGAAAACTSER